MEHGGGKLSRDAIAAVVERVMTGPQHPNIKAGMLVDLLSDARPQPCTECYICRMVAVFDEVRRVLRDDGTVWLNMGDSYGGTGGPPSNKSGLKRDGRDDDSRQHSISIQQANLSKVSASPVCTGLPSGNLVGVPWRLALALQASGWVLRQDIVWHKPSPMPESIQNRCTKAHEYIFLLAKSSDYFYDAEAIKERSREPGRKVVLGDKSLSRYSGGTTGNAAEGVTEVTNPDTANKRSVWTVPSEAYPGAHYACVDDQTEALTRTGWKRHDQLQDGEEIAAYDLSRDVLMWQPATFHRYPYEGDLVTFEKRDTSQRVTPNHRCLVKTRGGYLRVKQAWQLKGRDEFMMAAPMVEEPSESIGEDMAALVGWYLSEGYFNQGAACICQSESANPGNVKEITSLLFRLGEQFKKYRRVRDWRGRESLEVVFHLKGKVSDNLLWLCPRKMLTDAMTRLPRNELQSLLSAFIKGDGHTRLDDDRQSIVQKDRHRINQLQIIAIKLGYRTHLSQRQSDGAYALYLTRGKYLTLRGTNGVWSGLPCQHYKGTVWCPKVASTFWLARRDGKPFITGNTFPKPLIEPCIRAGTSEKGCCARCGAPWRRVIVGWEPTCSCHGTFVTVKRMVKVRRRKDRAYTDPCDRDHSLQSNRNSMSSTTLEPDKVEVEIVEEERDVQEYRPSIPLEDHPTRRCLVLDPFMGSGTTAVVSVVNNCACWGIELSEEYLTENAIPRIKGLLMARPSLSHLVRVSTRPVSFSKAARKRD